MTIWAVSLLKSELSPGFLTAAVRVSGIRSLVENSTVAREFSSSSSTSRPYFRDASPQAISERTSYRRTRLEFLLYTQVIPECCTARGFGPPRSFTFASPCSYVARPASGLVHAIINALIRLAFTTPPEVLFLRRPRRANSLARSAKSTPSPRTYYSLLVIISPLSSSRLVRQEFYLSYGTVILQIEELFFLCPVYSDCFRVIAELKYWSHSE